MLLLTFNWKNVFMFIFSLFSFIVMLENFEKRPFHWIFLPPWHIPPRKDPPTWLPLLNPTPQTKKILLKTSVHFPITITVCKHWSNFVTCSPPLGDCQRHSYYGFRLCGTKWLSQNFDPLTLGKNERGGGPRCPPFRSLRKGTRTFHFR